MPRGQQKAPTILEGFLATCSDRSICWVYPGSINRQTGYGKAWFRERQATFDAHRAAYIMLRGEVPKGLTLDHLCRNRSCCNPWHLEAVTIRVNLLRGDGPSANQARQTHCKRGHPLSGDNLFLVKGRKRGCVICRRWHMREYYRRRAGNHAEAISRA